MPDPIDWSLTTFEGNRRRQHQEFLALPFHEKVKRIEQMGEVAAHFAAQQRPVPRAVGAPPPGDDSSSGERLPET